MKLIPILLMVALISGCAGLAQKGALNNAYSNYEDGEYEDVIQLTSQAENFHEPTHEMKAEIIYLRALALEKMGRTDEATGLFNYLSQEFKDTQYGYMAIEKLN